LIPACDYIQAAYRDGYLYSTILLRGCVFDEFNGRVYSHGAIFPDELYNCRTLELEFDKRMDFKMIMVYMPYLAKFINLVTLQFSLVARNMPGSIELDNEEKRIFSGCKSLK
jgi:hypothetical protein